MPKFDIAHIRQQGVDLIIVPLERAFGQKIDQEKMKAIAELQARARAAGLAGTVVPIWETGGGRMGFVAPRPWHPFFRSLSLASVASNINKTLSW